MSLNPRWLLGFSSLVLFTEIVYEVNLPGLIWRASRSDVVMHPFIFLLTHLQAKAVFYISLETYYSI